MPLGRFLEMGIATQDLVAALDFYEALGFVQAEVGEAWSHAYAVVTDGRISFGLHGTELDGPVPTWTAPDLRQRSDEVQRLGIEFERVRLDDVSLNEAWLRDPSGWPLRLLEARTYSPPALAPSYESGLGYFEELALPTTDLVDASRFWDALGFVAFEPTAGPVSKVIASSRDLNVALYEADLPGPMPCFTAPDMPARIIALRDRGFSFARRTPRGLDPDTAAILQAPDGVSILLTMTAPDA